jgi:hypothetical protein
VKTLDGYNSGKNSMCRFIFALLAVASMNVNADPLFSAEKVTGSGWWPDTLVYKMSSFHNDRKDGRLAVHEDRLVFSFFYEKVNREFVALEVHFEDMTFFGVEKHGRSHIWLIQVNGNEFHSLHVSGSFDAASGGKVSHSDLSEWMVAKFPGSDIR